MQSPAQHRHRFGADLPGKLCSQSAQFCRLLQWQQQFHRKKIQLQEYSIFPLLSENQRIFFGISVITDLGGKDITEVPTHEEVQKAAINAQPQMIKLMENLVNNI